MKALLALLLLLALPAQAEDRRYCGPPVRDDAGVIIRSPGVLREFQQVYPCPLTERSVGSCPGWYKDHVIPLVCGGCDSIENLQWLPGPIKTCAGKVCKDRWERRVYCRAVPPPTIVPRTEP